MSLETIQRNPIHETLKLGQSLWYDGLIAPAEFERMIREDGIRGATTNPVIFEKALSGPDFDERVRALGRQSPEAIYTALAIDQVATIADLFAPVYNETDGLDGYVSIEVSPLLAQDGARTVHEAKSLFKRIGRPNVMIKIPATPEGLPAIREVLAAGIPVNATLIFSVPRYYAVMQAYVEGLETFASKGGLLKGLASVASFFVSRVDTALDALLDERAKGETEPAKRQAWLSMKGKIAIANCKVAYREFERFFSSTRFLLLKKNGARVQRPLWASTGTKNPAYSDVFYVENLIGPNTVDTMPPATLLAFKDHGRPRLSVQDGGTAAEGMLAALKTYGIDLDAITDNLEKAGIEAFAESYRKIIHRIEEKYGKA